MEDADLRLDGNAAAGALAEIFAVEITTAVGTCRSCGARGEVGSLAVYAHAPGLVVRCPACDAVLVRVVRGPGRTWLELTGVRSLELRSPDGP
jgi:Zn finger protein HypA/HybF involved in hydrogenase expression